MQKYIRRESYSRLFPPNCPTVSHHLPENSIFDHLPPFAPAYGRPPYPTSTFIDKSVNTECCYYDIYVAKAIPGCFHPIVLPSPPICLKIQFLTISSLFAPAYGRPLDPTSTLIDKNVITGCFAMIYTVRKLFQAVSIPLSRHFPPFA